VLTTTRSSSYGHRHIVDVEQTVGKGAALETLTGGLVDGRAAQTRQEPRYTTFEEPVRGREHGLGWESLDSRGARGHSTPGRHRVD